MLFVFVMLVVLAMLLFFVVLFVVFMVLMVHLCDKTTLLENRHVAEDQKHREKRIVVVVVVKTVPALDELYPHDIGWRE